MRILLVDDDEPMLDGLAVLLGDAFPGVVIEKADSARRALQILEAQRFDCVMSDIVMETPDAGWTLARAARAKGLRVLLMSADARAPWMVLERGMALVRKDELHGGSIASFVNGLLLGDPA